MNAHTPGPWFISYTHDGNTEIAIDDAPGINGQRDYDLVTVTHGDPDELRANARLIAAAPELLAALEHVLDRATMPGFLRDKVKAAIAKATAA